MVPEAAGAPAKSPTAVPVSVDQAVQDASAITPTQRDLDARKQARKAQVCAIIIT